jgi:hypothetical protein
MKKQKIEEQLNRIEEWLANAEEYVANIGGGGLLQ